MLVFALSNKSVGGEGREEGEGEEEEEGERRALSRRESAKEDEEKEDRSPFLPSFSMRPDRKFVGEFTSRKGKST